MKMLIAILVALALSGNGAALDCDSNEIACKNEEKCIPHTYICDGDRDCTDEFDEDTELCDVWRNEACGKNEARCEKDGVSECVTISAYCTSDDPPCRGDLDRRLCKMLEDGKLEELDNIVLTGIVDDNLNKSYELAERFQNLVPYTLRHHSCPPLYTLVGDQCLSIFHVGSMSWGEAREFCILFHGDLITFKNVSHYAAVVQHLQQYEITSSFWIGGTHANSKEGWTWTDGTPMELGSPYWATRYSKTCVDRSSTLHVKDEECLRYYQAPEKEVEGRCVSLDYEQFFYMSDDDCLNKMSPLCMYVGSGNPTFRLRERTKVEGAYQLTDLNPNF